MNKGAIKTLPGNAVTKLSYDRVMTFTQKGVLILRNGKERWLPRSEVWERPSDESLEAKKGSKKSGDFTVPLWLLKDELATPKQNGTPDYGGSDDELFDGKPT